MNIFSFVSSAFRRQGQLQLLAISLFDSIFYLVQVSKAFQLKNKIESKNGTQVNNLLKIISIFKQL